MSKNRNTKERSAQIQSFAQRIVDQAQHDSASSEVAKAMRNLWQKKVESETDCTPFTARVHVANALRLQRHVTNAPPGASFPATNRTDTR